MSERDELLRLLNDNITDDVAIRPLRCDIRAQVEQAADAILAAGYRKPRTITTAEELDGLPVGAIVRSNSGEIWERGTNTWDNLSGTGEYIYLTSWVALPAVVLWESGAEK